MFAPAFLAQLLSAASFPQGHPKDVDPNYATDLVINNLSTLTQGQKAALPTATITPSTATYKSLVFASSDTATAELLADGLQIKQPGGFRLTATLTRNDDSTLVATRDFIVDALLPNFTAQPSSDMLTPGDVYYQVDQPLNITGAAITNYSLLQWQKKQADGSYVNVTGQTALNFSKNVAVAGDEGTYRLAAVNGNKTAYSSDVVTHNSFLWMQNDGATNVGQAFSITQGADPYHWNMVQATQSGSIKYPSVRVRLVSAPTVDIAAANVGTVTAVSDTTDVVRVSGVTNRQVQAVMNNKVGTAILTIKLGLLTDFLTIPVGYAVPTITTQPAATIAVATGAKLEIKPVVGSNINATAAFQWQKLAADGTTWANVSGATAVTYTVAAAAAANAGSYRLVITNGDKSATTTTSVVTVS